MNKIRRCTIYLVVLCFGLIQTSCLGSFKLTNVTYQWNQTIGSKWVNELVFVLFIPVYAVTMVVDGLVLNAIDFWTERPGLSLEVGEQELITGKDGKEYLITRTTTGFTMGAVGQHESQASFEYVEDNLSWYLLNGEERIRLVQLVETDRGQYVRVFKEDGSSVMVDANLRSRSAILKAINQSEAEITL